MHPDLDDNGYLAERDGSAVTTWTELNTDGTSVTYFRLRDLDQALEAFGEDEVVERVRAGITFAEVQAIGPRHAELVHTEDPATASGAGYPFDKALAMAAVEILEGGGRPLARKRRRSRRGQ